MRRSDPVIVGAGPAGCAAAITLARGGARPVILEKAHDVGDALCGGFLSWCTIESLRALGVDPNGHAIDHLRVFSRDTFVSAPLPQAAQGLSRRVMDTALRKAATAAGAGLETGVMVRHINDLADRTDAVFLATGKHDLKGAERPRDASDPAMGLRIRLPASRETDHLIGSAIELHMFDRGYAGIELQEDGSANICLALRKSLLADHGRDPRQLLRDLRRHQLEPPEQQRAGSDLATQHRRAGNERARLGACFDVVNLQCYRSLVTQPDEARARERDLVWNAAGNQGVQQRLHRRQRQRTLVQAPEQATDGSHQHQAEYEEPFE